MSIAFYNTGFTLEDKYAQQKFNDVSLLMGNKLFPRVPVDSNYKHYAIWGSEFYQDSASGGIRAASAEAEEVPMSFSTDVYNCQERSFQHTEDERVLGTAQPELQVQKKFIELVTQRQLVRYERACAAATFSAAVVTALSGYTSAHSVTDRWDNASSDPRTQLDIAKASFRTNGVIDPDEAVLFISSDVWLALRKNPAIVNITKYQVASGVLTRQTVAAALGLKDIVVGSGTYATRNGTKAQIWGKYALLGFTKENPDLQDISFGKTFVLKERDLRIDSWYDQRKSSFTWRSKYDYAVKLTSVSSAYLFSTVIS